MAQLRDPKVNPLVALGDKLRATSVLGFRETRTTADGIELVAVDMHWPSRARDDQPGERRSVSVVLPRVA